MRAPYAHDAVVRVAPGGDLAAPGGAITVALCGGWQHAGEPCPLAGHHTTAERVGGAGSDEVRLRVLFAAEPGDEAEVRRRIEDALASGTVTGPDGGTRSWRPGSAAPGTVRADERDHARRLSRS